MGSMTIGELARRSGVGVETVRFYEKEGLIRQPARPEIGFRRYSADTIGRILFIRHAKDLGFTLKEIRELLSLRVDSTASCREVKKRAEDKMNDIERRIVTLRKMKQVLEKLTEACRTRKPTGECPILEALEAQDIPHERSASGAPQEPGRHGRQEK